MNLYFKSALIALASVLSFSAHAGSFSIDFDGLKAGDDANLDAAALANGVNFASGALMPDLDAFGNAILDPYGQLIPGQTHWEAVAGTSLTVADPNAYGHGNAPTGSLALNALWDQTLIQFAHPMQLSRFSFKLDGSSYGDFFPTQVLFLDGNGKVLLSSQDFQGSGTTSFAYTFAKPTLVSEILVPSTTKFYDAFTVTAVPEPSTWAMLAGGLVLVGAMARRRRHTA